MSTLIICLLFLQTQNPSLAAEYVVGPQDRLAITVFDEPTLTKTVTVDSEGSFEFPLVGRVKAGGLSVRQITADLKKRLGPPDGFLVNPQVNIEVETYRSQVVYVNGQVRVPGAIPLKGAMTIMDVLSQAGSPTSEAGPFIEIYRKPAGQPSQGPLDPSKASAPERVTMEDLRNGRAQQILLRDGDTVNVPKAQTFIVNGFVRTPNTYVLEGEVTVQKAIAMAGGVTERGALSRTRIQRMVDGRLIEIKAKMTDLVQPNDTIVVPQRFFYFPLMILHVANGRLFGGIERTLTTFAECGGTTFEFVVATEGRLLSELRDRDATVHFFGDVRLSHPSSVLRARHHFRNLLRRRSYAAVVCHAPWSHAIFAGVVRGCGVPVILWQHDRATGTPLVERACRAAAADLVICNSKWTATTAPLLQPRVPHRIIHCPVRASKRTPDTRIEVRRELGARAESVVILSASRMETWKGHLDLVRALARLSALPWVLWIAGGAQRAHERAHAAVLVDEVRRLGLDSRVAFLGERRDVDRLLDGADVLAQPNTEPEPFGIIFAEALRAGVPVVTTNMGGAPELVDDSCGRLVPPHDLAALVNALALLVSDRALRDSLGAAGRGRAATICDPSRVLAQLADAMSSIGVPTAA